MDTPCGGCNIYKHYKRILSEVGIRFMMYDLMLNYRTGKVFLKHQDSSLPSQVENQMYLARLAI